MDRTPHRQPNRARPWREPERKVKSMSNTAWQIPRGPQRIVCLTEEPTEILYQLGEGDRIVGISAYTVRPPEARQDKPVVSAFIGGSVKKIVALNPDLVIGFSDIQADLARDLISANLPVLIFNQRSIQEILNVIMDLGRLVNAQPRADDLVSSYLQRLEATAGRNAAVDCKPRIYFEEWDDPMICGIRWVSELIEIAGGRDVFAEKSQGKWARERFVDVEEVSRAEPDLILASWCGKPLDRNALLKRPGLEDVPAIQAQRIVEIPSEIILQPGPACLTDGLDRLESEIAATRRELQR